MNVSGNYIQGGKLSISLVAKQGNKVGSRNWMNKLHDVVAELARFNCEPTVQITSDNDKLNELLERVQGEITVTAIEFPWNDIPPHPRCNGTFNQYTGRVTHTEECELDSHKGILV